MSGTPTVSKSHPEPQEEDEIGWLRKRKFELESEAGRLRIALRNCRDAAADMEDVEYIVNEALEGKPNICTCGQPVSTVICDDCNATAHMCVGPHA